MLINIFKSNQKVISILVLILSILLWIPSFWVAQNQLINTDSLPFYLSNKVLTFVISSLLVGFQAIYLNYIVNEFKLLSSRTHLPALLFVVLNTGSSSLLVFTPLLIVNSLVLIILHQLFLIYNQNSASSLAFNVGFLIAVAALIYFPFVIVFLLLWLTLLYTKPPNWKELVIGVLGFLVPIVFYVSYFFFTDQIAKLIPFGGGKHVVFEDKGLEFNSLKDTFFYVFFIFGLAVGLHVIKTISNHVVKAKKHLVLLLLFAALLMTMLPINSSDTLAVYMIMTAPLSIFYADYLNSLKRKWLAELILSLLLIAILIGYFS